MGSSRIKALSFPKRTLWIRKASVTLRSPLTTIGYGPLPIVWIYAWPIIADCVDGEYWNPSPAAPAQIALNSEVHDPHLVLATILHELCHHATQTREESIHGPAFQRCARAAGLRPSKYWGTPTKEMRGEFDRIIRRLGTYPMESIWSGKDRPTTKRLVEKNKDATT